MVPPGPGLLDMIKETRPATSRGPKKTSAVRAGIAGPGFRPRALSTPRLPMELPGARALYGKVGCKDLAL